MKKTLFTLCASAILFTACNSTDQGAIDRQDSIKEAAAADSMLNDALKTDSLKADSL